MMMHVLANFKFIVTNLRDSDLTSYYLNWLCI